MKKIKKEKRLDKLIYLITTSIPNERTELFNHLLQYLMKQAYP